MIKLINILKESIINNNTNLEKYNLAGNCVTGLDDPYFTKNVCSDATEMSNIVDEYFNDFISSEDFLKKVNWPEKIIGPADSNLYDFAYNSNKDIYWAYNVEDDIHYFFIRDKINENYKHFYTVNTI